LYLSYETGKEKEKKMENTKTIKWTLGNGKEATVTISIDKHQTTINDGMGNFMKVDGKPASWTIKYSAVVDGMGELNGLNSPISYDNLPAGGAGKLGRLAFNADIKSKIENAIEEIKNSKDWKRHIATEKNIDNYYKSYSNIKKAMEE